jgi:nitroreductase
MAAAPIDPQTLSNVVALACRAPSLHNSQPWRLIAEGGQLRLFVEPHRAPRASDRSGREALISCGALLDHLRVAAAAAGWNAVVARFPNPNDLDHLATIDFHRTELITDAARARADAILARRTDRLPFAEPPGWPYIEAMLRDAVDPDMATLHVLPDSARPQLAEASRLTESLRRYDTSYHAELQWWTAPFEVSDGVPSSSLASASERDRVDVARNFPLSGDGGRRPEVNRDHAVIAVLSTEGGDRREALGCGEALSAVLLEATLAGLATCTLTHMTELQASRAIIRALTGSPDEPQLLIRIGEVPALEDLPPPTPRRPLADVLTVR